MELVNGTEIEEAVLTYTINDNLSISAGRMLSYLGFEAYDAPNMYQISTAYSTKLSTGCMMGMQTAFLSTM